MKSIFKAAILVAAIFTGKTESMSSPRVGPHPTLHAAIEDCGFACEGDKAYVIATDNCFAVVSGDGNVDIAKTVSEELPSLIEQTSGNIQAAFAEMQKSLSEKMNDQTFNFAHVAGFVLSNSDTKAHFFNCGVNTILFATQNTETTLIPHTVSKLPAKDRLRLLRHGVPLGALNTKDGTFKVEGDSATYIIQEDAHKPGHYKAAVPFTHALHTLSPKDYFKQYISTVPDIISMNPEECPLLKFVFIASKDFWSAMRNDDPYSRNMYDDNIPLYIRDRFSEGASCKRIANELEATAIGKAAEAGFTSPNISVMLVKFKQQESTAGGAAAAPAQLPEEPATPDAQTTEAASAELPAAPAEPATTDSSAEFSAILNAPEERLTESPAAPDAIAELPADTEEPVAQAAPAQLTEEQSAQAAPAELSAAPAEPAAPAQLSAAPAVPSFFERARQRTLQGIQNQWEAARGNPVTTISALAMGALAAWLLRTEIRAFLNGKPAPRR